jgi:hypothetical protein
VIGRRDLLLGSLSQLAPRRRYQIGAYYFPNYHVDPMNEAAHGPGWTEWNVVKKAGPRFPGHAQPKVPRWGYEDESDPKVFARKIDVAASHGLNHFIFDWYWYEGGPFLHRALENGYLKAPNNGRLRFALMWANHDWLDIQPAKFRMPPPLQYPGAVDRPMFEKITTYIVDKYFRHPSYWKIDGAPYFSIYELFRLVEGLGGIPATRDALDSFRRKTKAAGLPDLHLNAVVWGVKILPGEQTLKNPNELLAALGFPSVTSYVWIHHVPLPEFPVTPYDYVAREADKYRARAAAEFKLPYHPNVTMGWDSSPRTVQSDVFANAGYPFMATVGGNTPAAFKQALQSVKKFLDERTGQPPIFNINAWNEWTEGSYLEPDTVNGLAYLEAIHEVFP